jgi:hypothetical protein
MQHLAPSATPKPCHCLFHISAVIPDSYFTLSFSIVFQSTSRSATCSDGVFLFKASYRHHLSTLLQPGCVSVEKENAVQPLTGYTASISVYRSGNEP